MFTGIIREVGILKKKTAKKNGIFCFEIKSSKLKPKIGGSVSVNGACLSVTKKTKDGFTFDVIPETLKKTNLGSLAPNARLNLESSMRFSESFDGHFVTGHIDSTAKILSSGAIIKIAFPGTLAPFIAKKGSIALNGVSLTVADVKKNTCSVAVIPLTLKETNLGQLKVGDLVNVEVDLVAKYLYKIIKTR